MYPFTLLPHPPCAGPACRCRIVAPDLRCHGLTEAADEDDLSAATLAADVASLWRHMFGQDGGSGSGSGGGGSGCEPAAQQQAAGAIGAAASPAAGSGAQQGAAPPTVLVGHSMGGAVAVHAAASGGEQAACVALRRPAGAQVAAAKLPQAQCC